MRRVLPGLLIALAFAVGLPRSAQACACVQLPNGCQTLAQDDAILVGTVVRIDVEPNPNPADVLSPTLQVVRLADARTLKGEPADAVVTGDVNSSCSYAFRVGERYFIHARRAVDGRLTVGACGFTRPLSEASELLAYAESLAEPESGGQVWGTVSRPGSRQNPWPQMPAVGARVRITGPISRETTTDRRGGYHFAALPPGDYTATVSFQQLPGLAAASRTAAQRFSLVAPHACEIVDFESEFVNGIASRVVDDGRAHGRAAEIRKSRR